MRKFIKYLLFLIPWFLGALLFGGNYQYYNSLNLPAFAPPSYIFIIVWTILYILIAYSVYLIWDYRDKSYTLSLVVNYLANQLYTFFFFKLQSPILGTLDAIIVLLSSIYLYSNTKRIGRDISLLLILYVIWNIFATILSISILIMN